MARVDLCFQGWVRGYEVKKVTVVSAGVEIDVTGYSAEEVTEKLENGDWSISLSDALKHGRKTDVELFDFEESHDNVSD